MQLYRAIKDLLIGRTNVYLVVDDNCRCERVFRSERDALLLCIQRNIEEFELERPWPDPSLPFDELKVFAVVIEDACMNGDLSVDRSFYSVLKDYLY